MTVCQWRSIQGRSSTNQKEVNDQVWTLVMLDCCVIQSKLTDKHGFVTLYFDQRFVLVGRFCDFISKAANDRAKADFTENEKLICPKYTISHADCTEILSFYV